jgi:hypothetical protein
MRHQLLTSAPGMSFPAKLAAALALFCLVGTIGTPVGAYGLRVSMREDKSGGSSASATKEVTKNAPQSGQSSDTDSGVTSETRENTLAPR